MKKIKLDFKEQAKRMRESIKEEMQLWIDALNKDHDAALFKIKPKDEDDKRSK